LKYIIVTEFLIPTSNRCEDVSTVRQLLKIEVGKMSVLHKW